MTGSMCRRLEGRRAIVTGGASGIGEATALRLIEEGAQVMIADVQQGLMDALVAAQTDKPLSAFHVDMRDLRGVEAMITEARRRMGGLDILVNNAGIGSFGAITEIDYQHWRDIMSVDLDAVMWSCRTAMPLLEQSRGCIVNVASIAGIAGDYGFAAYNAAKAAVINLSRAMALDHAPHVRVNVVSPGLTATPQAVGLTQNKAIMEAWRDAMPLGRAARSAEVAAAIAFLASDDASYVNGHNLVVDGGGMAHSGMPNFTRILEGVSHLEPSRAISGQSCEPQR